MSQAALKKVPEIYPLMTPEKRLKKLREIKGLWGKKSLKELKKIRKEWDRKLPSLTK